MLANTKYLLILILALFLFDSCKEKEKQRPALQVATSYDSTNFQSNSTTQRTVLSQLKSLVDEIKKARTSGTVVNAAALKTLFNVGNPNLSGVGTTYFADKIQGTNGWLEEAAKASGSTYTPGPPVGEGGVFGAYLFDENGLELEQMVEKGQFGSVQYKHFTDLAKQPVTVATVDQMLAIFGSNPTLPNTPTASKTARPDAFFAVYACRRDKNDGTGYYSLIRDNFLILQSAVKAGNEYDVEKNAALEKIRINWEKANAGTIINYCHAIVSTLSKTTLTNTDKASALHALGECIGFLQGYKTIDQVYKKITDTQIDQMLELLQAPANATPTCYKVVTNPETELSKISLAITQLKSIYGFTDAEIEDFKKNWVAEQGR